MMSEPLLYCLVLLVAGLVLLWLEVLVVSFGLLGASALACLAGSVYFGFAVSPALGWSLALATPLIAIAVLVQGVRRVARSKLVMRGEMSADAGYHHASDRHGVRVGDTGVMVTPGMPSGRARFARGGGSAECDVRGQGGSLEAGATVRVVRIEGPTVEVVAQQG